MPEEAGGRIRRLRGSFILAGAREGSRKLRRLGNGAFIALERRRLRKAHIRLGWLGWQQAEFSEEFLGHVEEINTFERQQGRLLNERAEAAEVIAALRLEQAEKDAESLRALEQLAHERKPLALAHEASSERLAEKEREIREANGQIKKITDGEEMEARGLKALGKAFPPPGDLRARLLSIESRTSELRGRKRLLQNAMSPLQKSLPPLRADLKLRESALAALDRKVKMARAAHAAAARKLNRQIRAANRRKAALEKQGHSLEKRKKLPFLNIGRALADSNVAPLNQPEALRTVLRHRENIARREQGIAESLAASAREDTAELRKFRLLGAIVAAVLVLLLALAAEHTGHHAR